MLGREGSEAVAALLAERRIEVRTGTYPLAFDLGHLEISPDSPIPADRVISVARHKGIKIAGVPQDADFFIPTDPHGRVPGLTGLYAAGDITTFSVKQGGIASQQADAVAECLAAEAGAP